MSSEATTTNPFPFLVTARKPTAVALGALALGFVVCAIWWGLWGMSGMKADKSGPDAPSAKPGDPPAEFGKEKSADKDADGKTHSSDYLPFAIWAGLMGLGCAGSCAWLITREIDAGHPASAARLEVLTFGSMVGLLTALLGFALGLSWAESLSRWLNNNDAKEAKWVFIAVCIFFAGLTIMFLSTQLGRAEQRNNALLRRLMHGFNSVLHGILILILLVGANVVVFLKVPATFVANDAAFTALTDESKKFLRSLDQPVHAYLIMPERYRDEIAGLPYDNLYMDTRGLLGQCEDQNKLFKAEYLSPLLDQVKIRSLFNDLKLKGEEEKKEIRIGILLVVGEDRAATGFIPADELLDISRTERQSPVVFQGDNKVLSELAFLTDSRSKMAVYFSQNHGELSMEAEGQPDQSLSEMVAYLKSRKIRAEALKLDAANPRIPEDASVVIVAGPRRTITPTAPLMKALTEYVKPTASTATPGKLMVYLPAFRGLDSKVGATGLENLLAESGVLVEASARLVTVPDSLDSVRGRTIPPEYMLGVGVNTRHPLSPLMNKQWLLADCRPIRPSPQQNPALKLTPLMVTPRSFPTWQENDFVTSPAVTFEALRADPRGPLLAQKKFSEQPQWLGLSVGAIPANGDPQKPPVEKPRMLVFASDSLLTDRPAFDLTSPEIRQDLFGSSIDWLREREASIGIKPRAVNLYVLPKPIEISSKLTLLGMITLGLGALGVAVWYSRRR